MAQVADAAEFLLANAGTHGRVLAA